jgi:hypothetical protein
VPDEVVLGQRLEREDVHPADLVGGGERESAGEDAEPRERLLPGWVEQAVAPIDGGAQRSMALG